MKLPDSSRYTVDDTNCMPSDDAVAASLYIRPDLKDIPGVHGTIVRHISAVTVQQVANRACMELLRKICELNKQ